MSDEQQGQQGQESGNDEQESGQQGGAQRGAGGGTQDGGDDLAGLKTALDKERRARRDADRKFGELEAWKRQREQTDMSETERRDARLKEYEAKEQAWDRERQSLRLETAITAVATKAGAVNPEILHRLVDFGAVEWNDAGQPKNLTSIVNELKREYPAMFRTHGGAGNADAGAGNGGNQAALSMNSLIRRAAGRE